MSKELTKRALEKAFFDNLARTENLNFAEAENATALEFVGCSSAMEVSTRLSSLRIRLFNALQDAGISVTWE